jgi:CRISPR-associated protein Cmr3
MSKMSWRFNPMDTLFFRESRPHDAVGGAQLGSLFPPPARTVAGAVRTLIGNLDQVDWEDFAKPSPEQDVSVRLRDKIGIGDELGNLNLKGPWLVKAQQRLFPAPLYLLKQPQTGEMVRLRIGCPVSCDLGQKDNGEIVPVRLPMLPPGNAGAKPAENVWLSAADYSRVLQGEVPQGTLYEKEQLYREEPRLGIALDEARRTVKEGLLYQTRHIRPLDDVGVEVDLDGIGLDAAGSKPNTVRLGGEGRLVCVGQVSYEKPESPFPSAPEPNADTVGLILNLMTPADLAGHWLPDGFMPEEVDGVLSWRGNIAGYDLRIHAAVIGKARQEGGWDLAAQKPRLVKPLLPAGSAWYCTLAQGQELNDAIAAIHQAMQIGKDRRLGRGQLAVGLWQKQEYQIEEES